MAGADARARVAPPHTPLRVVDDKGLLHNGRDTMGAYCLLGLIRSHPARVGEERLALAVTDERRGSR
jgi:hypothetical protein